jgi:Ser-tRNA(Ala) deacylase AlaX
VSDACQLLYLTEPHLTDVTTSILQIGEDGGHSFVELPRTPFYPAGGGQACDIGRILGPDGHLEVQRVVIHGQSVRHFGDWAGKLTVGDEVLASIDAQVRQRHARWHTAGELLAAALHELAPDHAVLKANHRVGEAALVIDGSVAPTTKEALRRRLQAWMDDALARAGRVETLMTSDKALVQSLCGFFPEYLEGATSFRIVRVTPTFARPCVGCHVGDLAEIGLVTVRSISSKSSQTRVGYTVDDLSAPVLDGAAAAVP